MEIECLRIRDYELLNYIRYNEAVFKEYHELYKVIYRITDAFDDFSIELFKASINIWMRDQKEDFVYLPNIEKIWEIINKGDTKQYKPALLTITNKDINDIRVTLDYCDLLINGEYTFGESGEGLNPTIKGKENGFRCIKGTYEKYKDFIYDIKALESEANLFTPENDRLFYLSKLVNLWENEAEPFLRLFIENSETTTSKPQQEKTELLPDIYEQKAKEPKLSLAPFKKAIDKGYIEESDKGYIWSGTKAQLGYFIRQIYNPAGCSVTPYKRLEELFNIKRLDSIVDKAMTVKSPQKWRCKIDELIITDN